LIYFVQPTDGGPVKIGFSNNVAARVKELEGFYGRELVVLATFKGGRREEAEMHDRFSHLRYGRTEQFRPDMELMDFIGCPLFAAAGDVVEMPCHQNRKPMAIQMRGSDEWRAWVERGAAHIGLKTPTLVDQAVRLYLRENGFTEPPPER